MNMLTKIWYFSAALVLAASAFDGTAHASVGSGGNYLTGADFRYAAADGRESILPAGSMVSMLGTSDDGTMVHFGVDSDDASLPSEIWVKLPDVASMNLDIQTAFDEAQSGFSEDGGLSWLQDAGKSNAHRSGGMTYCYRGVKEYLLSHHMVKTYLPGASAYMAVSILPQYGFHKVNETPAQAKINDVCVYHGGRGNNGHIEVRVAGGWYYGYGVIPHSIRNHPFLGCFRKD